MKTSYRPKETKGKRSWDLFGLGILLVLLFIFSYGPIRDTLQNIAQTITLPFVYVGEESMAALSNFSFSADVNREALLEEALLEKELLSFELELLRKENGEMRDMLGAREDGTQVLVGVVLGKPNRSLYDTLLIDLGEEDGIDVGMLVIAGSSTPVGLISEVSRKSSLVRLFSSSGEKTPVDIGEKRVPAEALGVGGGNFRILLPKDVEIFEGDIIWLSGEAGKALGKVGRIDKSETETLARIFSKMPVSPYELSRVFVRIK